MNAIRESVRRKVKNAFGPQARLGDVTCVGLQQVADHCGGPGCSATAERIPATLPLNHFLILIKG
jgi:hypothetical protein